MRGWSVTLVVACIAGAANVALWTSAQSTGVQVLGTLVLVVAASFVVTWWNRRTKERQ